MEKKNALTTCQVLSYAYALIFSVDDEHQKSSGHFSGQRTSCGIGVEYAVFERRSIVMNDDDESFFEAVVEDGNEGCWIRVELVTYVAEARQYRRERVGTIKTLEEGRAAWKGFGALAGELSYVANNIAYWELRKSAKQSDSIAE